MNVNQAKNFHFSYIISFLLFVVILFIFLSNINNFKQYDLIQYWAGAKQLATNANPYNVEELFKHELKASEGIFTLNGPVVLYATPVIFPFIYFLSYLDFNSSRLAWLIINITIFYWVTIFYIKQNIGKFTFDLTKIIIPLFLLLSFTPFYSAIFYGQISWLLYLGWVGFLINFQKRPFLSGILLSLTLIKPHLLYLVYIFLILDSSKNKHHLLGLIFGASILLLISYLISPNIFSWYLEFSKYPPIQWKTLNLGSWLQHFTNIHTFSVRVIPSILTIIFLIYIYFSKFKLARIDYNTYIIKLSAISLLTAPYGWIYDSVILFPIIMLNAISLYNSKKVINISVVFLLITSVFLFFVPSRVSQDYYIWYIILLLFISLKL